MAGRQPASQFNQHDAVLRGCPGACLTREPLRPASCQCQRRTATRTSAAHEHG